MMAYSLWAIELLLECAGAWLNLRRSKLLAAILTMCAVTDVAAFLIFQLCSRSLYAWSYWAQHSIKNVMLIWLACKICGEFVGDRRKSMAILSTAFISAASVAMACVFGLTADGLKERLLNGEIAAMSILLGIILLGWIGRRDRLNANWRRITGGFILMVGGDLVFTLLWYVWDGARFWYPLSTIAAQLIWAVAPVWPQRLPECRACLPKRYAEIEKVQVM